MKLHLGLLQRRQCVVPTFRGWLVMLAAGIVLATVFVVGVFPFLAVNDPCPGGVLVVEGWGSEEMLTNALNEFKSHPYKAFCVTGVPLERSSPLSEYKTIAELGAATLIRLGGDPAVVHAVPAPLVKQDRTYASAVALKSWMQEHGIAGMPLNIMSIGAHSRRTRFLYQKAFGDGVKVGIIAGEERDFDASRWWASSGGFRFVTAEAIAYLYVRLLFSPSRM